MVSGPENNRESTVERALDFMQDNRVFRKPFLELIFPSHLKCGGTQKNRWDQQMSSNVHLNFQDKKIKDEVGLVSEVLYFTSLS